MNEEFNFGYFDIEEMTQLSIDRIKMFEPPEGYYLAFSGGKDSEVVYHLAERAGVKFDAHFSLTGVDPPEVLKFVRKNFLKVILEIPHPGMFQLIVKEKWPPTKKARYCCEELKERGGEGRMLLTGIRREESTKRSKRKMTEICYRKNQNKRFLHPIIDWTQKQIWEYIHKNGLPYCSLYDEGFERIGCILCPQASPKKREVDEKRWPGIVQAYRKAFIKMMDARRENNMEVRFPDIDEFWEWWMRRKEIEIEEEDNDYIPRFF